MGVKVSLKCALFSISIPVAAELTLLELSTRYRSRFVAEPEVFSGVSYASAYTSKLTPDSVVTYLFHDCERSL